MLTLFAAFVASWTLLPIRTLEVAGPAGVGANALARAAGLYEGGPWLYSPFWARRRLMRLPWVRAVRIERRGLGRLRLEVRPKKPTLWLKGALGLPGVRKDGLAVAADGRPLPLLGGVPAMGFGQDLKTLLSVAAAHPEAKEIRFTPAGFSIDLPGSRVWTPEPSRLGRVRAQGKELHLYAWGVSVKQ